MSTEADSLPAPRLRARDHGVTGPRSLGRLREGPSGHPGSWQPRAHNPWRQPRPRVAFSICAPERPSCWLKAPSAPTWPRVPSALAPLPGKATFGGWGLGLQLVFGGHSSAPHTASRLSVRSAKPHALPSPVVHVGDTDPQPPAFGVVSSGLSWVVSSRMTLPPWMAWACPPGPLAHCAPWASKPAFLCWGGSGCTGSPTGDPLERGFSLSSRCDQLLPCPSGKTPPPMCPGALTFPLPMGAGAAGVCWKHTAWTSSGCTHVSSHRAWTGRDPAWPRRGPKPPPHVLTVRLSQTLDPLPTSPQPGSPRRLWSRRIKYKSLHVSFQTFQTRPQRSTTLQQNDSLHPKVGSSGPPKICPPEAADGLKLRVLD
ncbi:uncharacterized protein LOC119509654 isoform X2 [Choloepus didactylus]|uniref:uncharacterized protein LOC119509654 isoform X2 n=1 Tax=Choloepus didactylus TaxID=27675 RepID=UPI0018A040D4|nr:uncharacterized protein LOC119509654 isoform X2 [Choloepus didactylus]